MQNDKVLFKKLKISSLLDLALLLPVSYSDTTLSTSLKIGDTVTVEAVVEDVNFYNGKLRVTFSLPRFHQKISSIFFRSTPYHHQLFIKGSRHYIQGRLDQYRGYLQINQPKSLKEIGSILPKYKTALKQTEIRELVKKYINEKNLYNEGLDSLEVATLINLHFPKKISDIKDANGLKCDIVQKLKFIEAYNHIRKLRGKRIEYPPLRALKGDIEPFVSSLPFELTDEQKSVIGDIRHDLSREDKAARRMIVGDVGSGKTMVILASVMMAIPYKSILMAPTSLLAIQLYEEAKKYLPDSIKIALVMQGNDEGDYTEADFIIGTHALLYRDDLPQASLVMVDEQHRFGTKQRAALEALVSYSSRESGANDASPEETHHNHQTPLASVQDGEYSTVASSTHYPLPTTHLHKPHYLQFSATPIPRTQAMMQSELLDVSLITSTPFKRSVETKVIGKHDFSKLLSHIKDEISKEHQVLIVYPLVEESEEVPYRSLEESARFWKDRFDGVYVTHGKDKQKEDVLLEFREKGSILLATTVIEVGISLPRLTLIVVVGAERLGLATLHQLRGRVGRSGLQSWCYLFSNNTDSERLQKFCQTTNGFEIAKLDLKFRDSGDILDGTIQSGQKFRWLDLGEDEEIVAIAKNRLGNARKV